MPRGVPFVRRNDCNNSSSSSERAFAAGRVKGKESSFIFLLSEFPPPTPPPPHHHHDLSFLSFLCPFLFQGDASVKALKNVRHKHLLFKRT